MSTNQRVLGFGALSLGTLAAAISTQVAAQPPAGGLEEITVTARRVEENLQDTPVAVTVVSGDALEERQIFETTELDQLVPNLQFADNAPLAGNNNSSQVFIRGIGQTDPTSTVDPGVGLYMDDVYIGSAVGATMGLRDIASIQVLRGPQGTLFGRNTIGGAILVTTVEPGDEAGAEVRASFGSDSLVDAFAVAGGAQGQRVALDGVGPVRGSEAGEAVQGVVGVRRDRPVGLGQAGAVAVQVVPVVVDAVGRVGDQVQPVGVVVGVRGREHGR